MCVLFAHFCRILRKFALFGSPFWREKTHRNAQKSAKTHKNAQKRAIGPVPATPPFSVAPLACTQIKGGAWSKRRQRRRFFFCVCQRVLHPDASARVWRYENGRCMLHKWAVSFSSHQQRGTRLPKYRDTKNRTCTFRKQAEYCLESTVAFDKLGEFFEELGEFALHTNQKGREKLTVSSLPGTRRRQKNSVSLVFGTVLSETIFLPVWLYF